MAAGVFDTYQSSTELEAFIDKIPPDMIIVAACKDECAQNLSQIGKLWFSNMGSKEIWNVKYRDGYAFVGVSGRSVARDKRGENSS